MHASSFQNMHKCYNRYLVPAGIGMQETAWVLDVGGADVNGSYREIFQRAHFHYLTADIAAEGVDIVLTDPYRIPLPNASMDVVLSGQMLEHCEFFWLAFQEMLRVMKPDGFLILIAPSGGPIHRYPVDCYRFYPDAYAALAHFAQCWLVDCWQDERGPWKDLVGVFRKTPTACPPITANTAVGYTGNAPSDWDPERSASEEEELVRGDKDYLQVLAHIHAQLAPEFYLEIGVRHGKSLALANCPAIGVDPWPEIDRTLPPQIRIYSRTSEDFFDLDAAHALTIKPDLVFIDGLHLFEYALNDFMQVERRASATTLVIVDDIFPNHPHQASRQRKTRVWTGDVWKLFLCLREWRSDLYLLALDTAPTGVLLIAGLDPNNSILWEQYNPIVRNYRDQLSGTPPDWVLSRRDARHPDHPALINLLKFLQHAKNDQLLTLEVTTALRNLRC